MFRVGETSPLIFLLQNAAQLSLKQKLDFIRNGCKYLTLSALLMCTNAQVLQRTYTMSCFQHQGRMARGVVSSSWGEGGGRGGITEEAKEKDGNGQTTILKNLGWIESGGGCHCCLKGKHGHFLLLYVIYCDNRILTYLLLEIRKGVYAISSTLERRLSPHKIRVFVQYVSCDFLKYQIYIGTRIPVWVNYYRILYKSPHY